MEIFWIIVTFATVAALIAWAVWAFLIEPIRVPTHHKH